MPHHLGCPAQLIKKSPAHRKRLMNCRPIVHTSPASAREEPASPTLLGQSAFSPGMALAAPKRPEAAARPDYHVADRPFICRVSNAPPEAIVNKRHRPDAEHYRNANSW